MLKETSTAMTTETQEEPARNPHASTARFCQQGFLQRDAVVVLSSETTRHARSVLRLREGERVRLFNEEHGEWLAELVGWQGEEGTARCLRCLRQAHEGETERGGPTLYFSPIRAHRIVWLLSGAVELGVSKLVPFRSRYTNAHFSHARALRTVKAAVEQSERLTSPVLEEEQPLCTSLVTREERLLFCAERGAASSLQDVLEEHADARHMAMLVGPEGGFSEEEQTMLRACRSIVPVSLGARVLRCETAVLSVLACWQAGRGRWGHRQNHQAEEQNCEQNFEQNNG